MVQIRFPVPFPELDDPLKNSIIENTVESSLKNGPDHLKQISMKEQSNMDYAWIKRSSSPEYMRYCWIMFIKTSNFSKDLIEEACREEAKRIVSVGAGELDLRDDDKVELLSLLNSNTGSKEDIKSIRKWVLERSHSLAASCFEILKYGQSLQCSSMNFRKLLHILYVVNDIMFNGRNVTQYGLYTKYYAEFLDDFSRKTLNVVEKVLPCSSGLLKIGLSLAIQDIDRDKIWKMVDLWSRDLLNTQQSDLLRQSISHMDIEYFPVPQVPLLSPYPIYESLNSTDTSSRLPSLRPPPPPPPVQQLSLSSSLHVTAPPTTSANHHGPTSIASLPPPPPPPPPLISSSDNVSFLSNPLYSSSSNSYPYSYSNPPYSMGYPGTPYGVNMVPGPPYSALPLNSTTPTMGYNIPLPLGAATISNNSPCMYPSTIPIATPNYVDLSKIPVGNLVSMAKESINQGSQIYAPINPYQFTTLTHTHVEPGRLEIRLSDFYSKYSSLGSSSSSSSSSQRARR